MKVLLISHTCFSTYNNMGKTFLSLFSSFSKDELCQLYVYPSLPDIDVCSSYYRITDKEAVKGVLPFVNAGGVLNLDLHTFGKAELFEHEDDVRIYKRKGNGSPSIRILRDVIWNLSGWYTHNLKSWIEEQRPTCIFLAPGYAKFIYDIAMKIHHDYKIPIVTYICDDYYFVKEPRKIIGKLQLALLRRKICQLEKLTSYQVVISKEMENMYSRVFNIPSSVLMTGTDVQAVQHVTTDDLPKDAIFSYFGNIGYNRYVSIAQIGRALHRINLKNNTNYQLNIYTSESNPDILSTFNDIPTVHICGFVSGFEYQCAVSCSHFLLHVEAFDDINVDTVKFSVSTKIAESLARGIPMFAYGPESVASMQHLIRNNCAYIAVSENQLEEELCKALENNGRRQKIIDAAIAVAGEFHNNERNSAKLRDIIEFVQGNVDTYHRCQNGES